ncbi:hypothetical protein HAZT_HAZT002680 [Hyalella azteca]|uniref:Uncharacterized protein n=1 Tax=Hyalella azteca TaxID=294128 RepID=A0A6A0GWI3_HYAAZ|nr:hypothetical protein HAZT_HAZT002680 [Hyalella azteca]
MNHEVHYSVLNPNDFVVIRPTSGVIQTTGKPFDREDAAQFAVLVQVKAVDADEGDFGRIRYELVRGSGELFTVDRVSGEVILRQPLVAPDRTLHLVVAAYDGGTPPLSSQAHVALRIVSSPGPEFDWSTYSAVVPEDAPAGTVLSRVFAVADSGVPLVYSIVEGDPQHLFGLDFSTGMDAVGSVSGILHTIAPLDFESKRGHNLTVRASDPVSGGYTDTLVEVSVTDVNDNRPAFEDAGLHAVIYEAAVPGTVITRVDGCDDGRFDVASDEGTVSVARQLDRDFDAAKRFIKILASDGGLKPLTSTTSVFITVEDFNDNAPVWTDQEFRVFVAIEADAGQVIAKITARDPDASDLNKLRYHISGGDYEHVFLLQEKTGVLSVVSPHKLVSGSLVSLNVTVSDGVHAVANSLNINVLPSNSHSPRFAKDRFDGTVPENVPPGTLILRLEVEDDDQDIFGRVHFTLFDNFFAGTFALDAKGRLYSKIPLDRETISSYSLVVSATDGGGKQDYCKVFVHVEDRNDNPPAFSLPEYQADLNAQDPDEGINSEVTYQIYKIGTTETMDLFHLDSASGELSLLRPIIGLGGAVFQMFVRATDRGVPAQHSDVPVTVFIHAPVASLPHCPLTHAQFFISEDAPKGTVVTSLWVSGPLLVKYSITDSYLTGSRGINDDSTLAEIGTYCSGCCVSVGATSADAEQQQHFAITPSGHVILQKPLDREIRPLYTINVMNSTLTEPPALDYMTLSVIVLDANDNAPRFCSSSYSSSLPENTDVGSTVLLFSASDPDAGVNAQIQYGFADDTTSDVREMFQVSPTSGALILISPLDRESVQQYKFTVIVSDAGLEPQSSSASVQILVTDVIVARLLDRENQDQFILHVSATDGRFTANTTVSIDVLDINDNGPVCVERVLHQNISEDAAIGTYVTTVAAWDTDTALYSRTRFSLAGEGSLHFSIDEHTGQIVTANLLDRESQDEYHFLSIASDWEQHEWQCSVEVHIFITDVNDNPPEFQLHQYSLNIPEDFPLHGAIARVIARDPDLGKNRNKQVGYSLQETDERIFSISPTQGLVKLDMPLDRERQDRYTITVWAHDKGDPPMSSSAKVVISVVDVNDNPPEFLHRILHIDVAENSALGTEIARVVATSKDIGVNGDISYSLQSVSEEHLHVHKKTGAITVAKTLDYENTKAILATVLATDGGYPALSSTCLLNVTILDVNDNAPVFEQETYFATVSEDASLGTILIKVSAHDADSDQNNRVRYAITDGDNNGCFSLNARTGALSLSSVIDRETEPEYLLKITASDSGTPALFTSATVSVKVLDVNDNPPVFEKALYSTVMQVDKVIGSPVTRLLVTDKDDADNGAPFTFEIQEEIATGAPEGDYKSVFNIDQEGTIGLARTGQEIKVGNSFLLKVRAWDSGSPPLHSDVFVNISIVEESNYPPVIQPLKISIFSYTSPYKGGIVGKIRATDRDPYDILQYSLSSSTIHGNSYGYFEVDSRDGTLVVTSHLDGEGMIDSSSVRVDDNQWHLINVTRVGTVSVLSVDGNESSSVSPGENDLLNFKSGHLYFGAQAKGASTEFIVFQTPVKMEVAVKMAKMGHCADVTS